MEHRMRLVSKYFNAMKRENKNIEIRLNDLKRQLINKGDYIYFEEIDNKDNIIKTKVIDKKEFNSFEELIDNYDIKYLGATGDTKENLLSILNEIYSESEVKQYKALAIVLEKYEKSCGIIVFNQDKVLLVHHNKGHWGIPKGHVEENETEEETAIREVKEETNVDAKIIGDFRKVITYSPKENTMKDVVCFVGTPLSFDLKPQLEEASEVGFFEINEALELISENARSLLKEAYNYYKTDINNS